MTSTSPSPGLSSDRPSAGPSSPRWGILGPGGIARAFTSDLRTAGLDVAAVGSRRRETADAFAADFAIPHAHGSYEDLVADPDVDIVYIATPHPMHAANALMALEAGKHVLVEKPFTLNAAEAAAVRDAAADRGLLAMEAMWTRYLPHMVRIREIVASGALGEIRAVTADHTQRITSDPTHRLNDLALGGGALLDLGIYPVSFAWDILGEPLSIVASARLGDTGADTEIATIMAHESGALSTTLSASRAAGPNTAAIIGTEARLEIARVWYTPTSFRVVSPDGTVLEDYVSKIEGRGMQYQALAAGRYLAEGRTDSDVLPIDETVAIMETLDEIRTLVGVHYPGED
ncbi:Gfo/Idh/MocA family oxidoreductase [Microbacterium yannicii]|uniref:Gfo/Idh/MocA family oxidoreductase n=1 Tax=Microbacterium yannicii TaxID=671622 RepID=A0ABP9M9W5_9MICO|nr:Gfo/Idh/MocA family oxidoreductase [Microbacterium yannicii]MCO5951352.1 Gfo/Idh/MocA family oxidoreductase [Microbacterium yannicii]